MKSQLFCVFALLFLASSASSQNEFSTSGDSSAGLFTVESDRGVMFEINLTQSTDPNTITPFNSISCNNPSGHADNSYYRVFDLDGEGLTEPLLVENVNFGIEGIVGGSQPVSVILHTLEAGDTFVVANLTEIGRVDTTADTAPEFVDVPFSTSAISPDQDLVVEIFTPNGQDDGFFFFIGSNNLGESAPSFIRSEPCGITEPTATSNVGPGFPGMNIVMTVSGSLQPVLPESQPVPVNNFWAMAILVLMLSGLGAFVIRRMA